MDPLLFALLHFSTRASQNHFIYMCLLFVWVLLSKVIKLIPLFRRNPRDIRYIPVSILFGWFHSFIKLYAALTLNNVCFTLHQRPFSTNQISSKHGVPDSHRLNTQTHIKHWGVSRRIAVKKIKIVKNFAIPELALQKYQLFNSSCWRWKFLASRLCAVSFLHIHNSSCIFFLSLSLSRHTRPYIPQNISDMIPWSDFEGTIPRCRFGDLGF